MIGIMIAGRDNRATGATKMNPGSSRSHSIFSIIIDHSNVDSNGETHYRMGKLNLVDLAGSERQSKTEATGDRFKEATKINLSLAVLGNVINKLVSSKKGHIPYRESKLTMLLQDSLGGNTKTVMIANVGPADYNYDETLSTLWYASNAKKIKNKPKINEDPKDALLREYQDEIEKLKMRLSGMDTKMAINDSESSDVSIRKTIESLEKDNESLRKDCENNRKNNDRIKDEYKDLLDQLRKLKDNHEEEKRKWDDKLFSLEKSFERDRILFKKQLRESVEDKKSDESSALDKKPTTYTITSSTLLDYNSEENNILLRNKVSILESKVQKLKSVVKLKENKNANIFRLNGEIDILKKEKSKMKNELDEIKNMYEIQIKDLLQKVNIRNNESEYTPRRASLKPGNYNSKHLLENLELEEKIERQTVENKFLSEQIEILKKDIQNSKIIKDHEIKKILLDLEDANTVAATAKISLAQLQFEKDTEIIKYKNICKKLKIKLGNLKMSKNIQISNQNNNLTSSAAPKKSYSFFRDIFK